MTITHNQLQNYLRSKIKHVAAAADIAIVEQTVIIDTNGTYALTLPPVAEARGRIYGFTHEGATGAAGSVTVTDNGDDASWTDLVMNAQHEKACVYSDGVHWHALEGATS